MRSGYSTRYSQVKIYIQSKQCLRENFKRYMHLKSSLCVCFVDIRHKTCHLTMYNYNVRKLEITCNKCLYIIHVT